MKLVLPPKRVVAWFLVRLTCLLGLFLFPWPGLGKAYGRAAGALANMVVAGASIQETATIDFDRPLEARDSLGRNEFSTELRARKSSTGEALHIPIELRTLTYIPTAVFVALTLASPIWLGLRGVTVLVGGLVLLHGFLVVSLAVPLLLFFADPMPMKLIALSVPSQWLMNIFYRSLVAPPSMIYVVPALIWLLMLWMVPSSSTRPARDAESEIGERQNDGIKGSIGER